MQAQSCVLSCSWTREYEWLEALSGTRGQRVLCWEGGSEKLVSMFKRTKVKVSILGYREGMILVEDL